MSCFFTCKDKQAILGLISGSKEQAAECLGSHFEELDADKAEGAGEKHVPQVAVDGNIITVTVGSILHPMTEEHGIDWIYLKTKEGSQLKKLAPGEKPQAAFALTLGDTPIAAYAYCNLHGFWKTDI